LVPRDDVFACVDFIWILGGKLEVKLHKCGEINVHTKEYICSVHMGLEPRALTLRLPDIKAWGHDFSRRTSNLGTCQNSTPCYRHLTMFRSYFWRSSVTGGIEDEFEFSNFCRTPVVRSCMSLQDLTGMLTVDSWLEIIIISYDPVSKGLSTSDTDLSVASASTCT
jgi:hypothetical protein